MEIYIKLNVLAASGYRVAKGTTPFFTILTPPLTNFPARLIDGRPSNNTVICFQCLDNDYSGGARRAAIDVETGREPRGQTDRRPETPCLATRPRAAASRPQCLLREQLTDRWRTKIEEYASPSVRILNVS
ncbi:unnamed protein product [Pieris brassicae]|uniref:Uncharacterized protein n=1 Tax=Pieris brassicae TaxID=7116 RepID=A0A9P0SMZ2_PIEBR|nr:unnamed protein product [Pieris brassicae]